MAAIAAALAAGVWISRPDRAPTAAPRIVSSILPPAGAGFDIRAGIALSPDGTRIAFAARRENEPRTLWIRELDGKTALMLAGTEDADTPFWSPDGRPFETRSAAPPRKTGMSHLFTPPGTMLPGGLGRGFARPPSRGPRGSRC